jgi:hypothetical protein
MDIYISFIWTIIFFDKAFKYGDGTTFWGYVGTNSEPFCWELCNVVQCRSIGLLLQFVSLWPSTCPFLISFKPSGRICFLLLLLLVFFSLQWNISKHDRKCTCFILSRTSVFVKRNQIFVEETISKSQKMIFGLWRTELIVRDEAVGAETSGCI